MNYNKMIDHTVLKADTPLETVKRICDEAMEYGFASVCINPCHVAYCADYLKDSDIKNILMRLLLIKFYVRRLL